MSGMIEQRLAGGRRGFLGLGAGVLGAGVLGPGALGELLGGENEARRAWALVMVRMFCRVRSG